MTRDSRYCAIDGEELYRKLVMGEPVVVLDVRTETEHAARHIPGSLLIPLHELQSRVGEIPNSGTPVAVLSEKGIRAESACKLLAEHAISPLLNLTGGLQHWTGPTAASQTGAIAFNDLKCNHSSFIKLFRIGI